MRKCSSCKGGHNLKNGYKTCPKCITKRKEKQCDRCKKTVWKDSKLCLKCLGKKQTGKGSPTWKGGKIKHKKGYVLKMAKDHPRSKSNNGYVFEHILVMEKKLGRYLVKGENIHHINGVKDDNRIKNLELWTKPQPSGIRLKDAVKWAKEILSREMGC